MNLSALKADVTAALHSPSRIAQNHVVRFLEVIMLIGDRYQGHRWRLVQMMQNTVRNATVPIITHSQVVVESLSQAIC